ncbi:MAG: glycosyltransferase [Planctomycetota bacterium]
MKLDPKVGIIAIGRNEAAHLHECFTSCASQADVVIYVDSDSSDNSVEIAMRAGAEVLALDHEQPLSAARARNEGFAHIRQIRPEIEFVQFIDGDCVLADDWCTAATATLRSRPDVAIVCGRLREKHPEASVFNRLCDLEWDQPAGETESCGGIFMARATSFAAANGFDTTVVAGEEPELCLRLRRMGNTILRIDDDMARHDAAMTGLRQWHKRLVRSGHAYAQGAALHGFSRDRHYIRECVSIWAWAFFLPLVITTLSICVSMYFGLGVILYCVQIWRTAHRSTHMARHRKDNWIYATSCILGKFSQLLGQWSFMVRAMQGKRPVIVEHKVMPTASETPPDSSKH